MNQPAAVQSIVRRPTFPALQTYPHNQWYVAAFSRDVTEQPLARTLLDTPVVLYRSTSGLPVALHDRCPHRGLPLSMGERDGDLLRCGYHGIEFGTNGKAVFVPMQKQIYPSLCVRSYPVVERGVYVFIWLGDAEADESILPGMEWLSIDSPDAHLEPYWQVDFEGNFQFLIDNLSDVSHLSYLHKGLLDGGDLALSTFNIEEGAQHYRMTRDVNEVRLPEPIAAMFRAKPHHPYRKVFVNASFIPSIHIGHQIFYDLVDSNAAPIQFMVINAVTPSTMRSTFMFDSQVYLNHHGSDEDKRAVHVVLEQDRIAINELQRRYDQFGDTGEVNVVTDQCGLIGRKIMDRLVKGEAPV